MKKLLLGMLLLIVLGVGGGLWWAYRSMDGLVASAIRSYGPEITGVKVKLGSVKIVPAEGTATLQGLELGSPKGFKADHVLVLDDVKATLDVSTLTSDVVIIKELVINKPDIIYEKGAGGTSNIDALLLNVNSYVAQRLPGTQSPASGKAPGRKFVIDNVYLRNCKASLSHPLLGNSTVGVALPDLHLTGVGRKSNGATMDEVTRQILAALSQSLGRAAGNINLGGAVDGIKGGAQSAGDKLKGLFGK